MPDIQSLQLALGAMPQKERDDFLGAALSKQPVEFLENILNKLGLENLPVSVKVRLVFKMGLTPIAHGFKTGADRQLQWIVPVVPDHLRPLVYSTSRLINEFQETLACLQNGRGDFVKAFTLLNPETMLEMVNRFNDEMQTYTQQLREANGRLNRYGAQRGGRGNGPKPAPNASSQATPKDQPAPAASFPEEEAVQKPRKASARTRSKAQSLPAEESNEMTSAAGSPALEVAPEPLPAPSSESFASETIPSEAGSPGDVDGESGGASSGETVSSLTKDEMAAFGFDVLAAAAESPAEESGK